MIGQDDVIYKNRYIWNRYKDELNRRKHHLSFKTASMVFDDPFHTEEFDADNSVVEDMNNSVNTLNEKMMIDQEIEEMKKHPIDYSDIPERKEFARVRLARKEFLDTLPPDIVQEMARRRLDELKAAGYEVAEKVN